MSTNNLTTTPATPGDMPQTEIWFDGTGLHIQQPGAGTVFVPTGRTGMFFDGLLKILVGSAPIAERADRVTLG